MLIRRRWGRSQIDPLFGCLLIGMGLLLIVLLSAHYVNTRCTWDKVILKNCTLGEFLRIVEQTHTVDSDRLKLVWVYLNGPSEARGRRSISSSNYIDFYALTTYSGNGVESTNVSFFTVRGALTPRQQFILTQSGKVADIRRYRPFPYSWGWNWSILYKE